MKNRSRAKSKRQNKPSAQFLEKLNLNAAGIDIGATEHYVCVPADRDPKPVRVFATFTADLHALADWLKACRIDTVVMESTGVYWIPVFQILERAGLEVKLVNARHVKNLPGRKTDLRDCQWLQQLHTYGLLTGSFRPSDDICVLRSYLRLRDNHTRAAARHVLHIQKALQQMNLQLHHVISDVTGVTGLDILQALLAGERDPHKLAALKQHQIKSSRAQIAKALVGDWRPEHLFALRQALEAYQFYQNQIAACDAAIQSVLARFQPKIDPAQQPLAPAKPSQKKTSDPLAQMRAPLYQMCGVDLTAVPGLGVLSAQVIVSEIGLDMTRWKTEKHFASWLGLCPEHRITGGAILKRQTRIVINRASIMLRRAAATLRRSPTALGAFFRRICARRGAAKAVTATAHKLAKIIYRLLKFGHPYVETGQDKYEEKYRARLLKHLQKSADSLGFQLVPKQPIT